VNLYYKDADENIRSNTRINAVVGSFPRTLWWLHVLFPTHSIGDLPDASIFSLISSINSVGIIETVFSKWKYARKQWSEEVFEIPVEQQAILHACRMRKENVAPEVRSALALWSQYNQGKFCGDPAIRANPANSKDRWVTSALDQKGLDFLIEKEYIRKVYQQENGKYCLYYQSPTVSEQQESIIKSFKTIMGRAAPALPVCPPEKFNAAQIEGLQMQCTQPICLLTGLAGAGKTETTTTAIPPKTGGTTPSHASRQVFAQRCAGRSGIASEVIQFTRYGFKRMGNWRMIDFLLTLNGVADTSPFKAYSDYCRAKMKKPDWSTFVRENHLRYQFPSDSWDDLTENSMTTLVVDECSMVDLETFAESLKEAVLNFPVSRVIVCGDPHQLKSIGKGNVLQDLIQSGVLPHVHLVDIVRSGKNTALSKNQKTILQGDHEGIIYDDTFVKVDCTDAPFRILPPAYENNDEEFSKGKEYKIPVDFITDHFMDDYKLGEDPLIIVATNREVHAMNASIVRRLFGPEYDHNSLATGMRVIVVQNYREGQEAVLDANEVDKAEDLEILNDDQPTVHLMKGELYMCQDLLEVEKDKKKFFSVTLMRWRSNKEHDAITLTIPKSDIKKVLKPGYCSTGHKSQGGETDYVYLLLFDNCSYYDREALYTNNGRARKRTKVFTRKSEMQGIVERLNRPRWSTFSYCLQQAFK
jgi:hypothetical protein